MNAKKMLLEGLHIIVLVALAALVTAGGVAADHGSGPVHAHVSTRVRFEQYLEESGRSTAVVPASETTRVRFEQYREALKTVDHAYLDASSAASNHSGIRFEQYLNVLDEMEHDIAASLSKP